MAEEFEILTPETEGGSELLPGEIEAILDVSENMEAILLVASSIVTGAPLVSVDGNVTKIQVKRKTAAQWAADPTLIPFAGEVCVILDDTTGNFEDMKIGDGNVPFPTLPSIGAAYSSAELNAAIALAQSAAAEAGDYAVSAADSATNANTALTTALTDAQAAAAAAEAAATGVEVSVQRADDYANKPANIEVVAGKYSANHYAELAAARARIVAKVPIRWLDNTHGPVYTITPSDLYRFLYYTGSNALEISLPPDLDTTPAFDGSVGVSWFKVVHWAGASVITLAAASAGTGSLISLGRYGSSFSNAIDTAVAANHTATISVGAGDDRILWISAFEVNASPSSHVVNLTTNVGTVTKLVNDTSPTGEDVVLTGVSSINSAAWRVVLPDSTSATSVTLTFAAPANMVSLTWWGGAMAGASDVQCSGASALPPAASSAITFSHTAGQRALLAVAHQNGSNTPGTTSGLSADSSFRSGTRGFKDVYVVPMYSNAALAAGNTTATVNWTDSSKCWAHQLALFTPSAGASTVTIINAGDLTLGAQGEWAEVYCHSYGNVYSVLR